MWVKTFLIHNIGGNENANTTELMVKAGRFESAQLLEGNPHSGCFPTAC